MAHNPNPPEGEPLPPAVSSTDAPADNLYFEVDISRPDAATGLSGPEEEQAGISSYTPDSASDVRPQAHEPLLPPPDPRVPASEGLEERPRKRGYGSTIALALGGAAAEAVVGLALQKLGMRAGNPGWEVLTSAVAKRPIKGMVGIAVVMPLIEELIFRAIPSRLVDTVAPRRKGTVAWGAGIASSAAFALMHGTRDPEDKTKRIYPVQQLSGGMMQWYLHRTRGFNHAVVAHAAVNSVAAMAMLATVGYARIEHAKRGGSKDTFDLQHYLKEIFDDPGKSAA